MAIDDGDGFLRGGTNTNGMLVALKNTNTGGVTSTSASGAATATSGFEMWLPFADLGIAAPQGTIQMMALLSYGDGTVGNQFLPGLGGGYGNLGKVPLNLNTIPGQQYALIALADLPGDWDGDGHIDINDFAAFESCYSGPDGTALGPGCSMVDFDLDQDVDLHDFATFQTAFTN